jgi:putative nucleotidyltransferase with HDIG domain
MTAAQAFWIVLLSILPIVAVMVLPLRFSGNVLGTGLTSDSLKVKELAPRDVYVRNGFRYIDEKATQQAREAAAAAVLPPFYLDIAATTENVGNLEELVSVLKQSPVDEKKLARLFDEGSAQQAVAVVSALVEMTPEARTKLSVSLQSCGTEILNSGYYDSKELSKVSEEGYKKIAVRGNLSGLSYKQMVSQEQEYEVSQLTDAANLAAFLTAEGVENPQLLSQILALSMRPNVLYDGSRAIIARQQAYDAVKPVEKVISSGQQILVKDSLVTQEDIDLLAEVELHSAPFDRYEIGGRLFFLILAALVSYAFYWLMDGTNRRRSIIWILYLILMDMAVLTTLLAMYLCGRFGVAHWEAFVPVVFGTLFISETMNMKRYGVLFTIQLAFYCFFLPSSTWFTFFYLCIASLGVLFLANLFNTRRGKMASVFLSVLWYLLMTVLFYFVQDIALQELSISLLGSLVNFTFCFSLVLLTMPFVDSALNLPTVFRLKELESLDTPLLERLKATAQGTYNHSLAVSELAYNAALAIGANAELCKVAALYHDVGKLDHPDYFTENQEGEISKHTNLKPQMSAAIIRSHVKLGVEKCRDAGLPAEVIQVIGEHHGNDLIKYFYEEAMNSNNENGEEVAAADYHYTAQPPSSKESAILMLADSVEAATKSLKNTTPTKLHRKIHAIFMGKLSNNQLNDSHLDLTELDEIEKSLENSLVGKYHTRISYPGDEQYEADHRR